MSLFSIIVPVYNDWAALDCCLSSIAQQIGAPPFEVIVIDDGSNEGFANNTSRWGNRLSLKVIRQGHQGISAARNHGIRISAGSLLLFVDADCRLQPDCLAALQATVDAIPQYDCFQLRLIGSLNTIVGKAEHLRLSALQQQLLQPDGRIRYLNTAGFAIRRTSFSTERGLFNPVALRAEDTLLLTELIQRGELPFFVNDAIIQHDVNLTLFECVRKDLRSAFLEQPTYALIAQSGIRIRMRNRDRLQVIWSSSKESGQIPFGKLAWLTFIFRQSLLRGSAFLYQLLRIRFRARPPRESTETQV